MVKFLKKIIAVALCSGLVFSLGSASSKYETYAGQEAVDEAQQKVEEAKKELEKLKGELSSISSSITDTKAYISQLDSKLESYTVQLVNCQGKIDAKQLEINDKIAEINLKEDEITEQEEYLAQISANRKEQYEAMKLRIQYMYECGEETFLDMIFSADDLSDMLGRAEYINSITDYDRKQLEGLAAIQLEIENVLSELEIQKNGLQEERAVLESEQATLLSLKADLENQQNYIDTILAEKERTLSTMEGQQNATQVQVDAAKAELEEQERILAAVKKAWEEEQKKAQENGSDADKEAEKTLEEIGLNGGFTYPMPGYNYVTSRWGMRIHPIYKIPLLHDGVDVSGAGIYGKPIVAAYSGTVSIADSSNATTGYGYYVKIDHGVGVATLYAHCSLLAVKQGQTVQAGQVIGYVGSTGNSTGAHLHFSVFVKGQSVDPVDYFPKGTFNLSKFGL